MYCMCPYADAKPNLVRSYERVLSSTEVATILKKQPSNLTSLITGNRDINHQTSNLRVYFSK